MLATSGPTLRVTPPPTCVGLTETATRMPCRYSTGGSPLIGMFSPLTPALADLNCPPSSSSEPEIPSGLLGGTGSSTVAAPSQSSQGHCPPGHPEVTCL